MVISLKESNKEHWNLTYRFALDIGAGKAESVFDFNSILFADILFPFRIEECIYEIFGKGMRNYRT